MRHDAIPFPTAALLAALSCLCAAPRAQAPTAAERPVALVASAGVTEDELGRPIAIGPDWECEFDADGARFLPVLGGVSPALMDLRLRAASVRRGDASLALAAEVPPQVRGDRVSFQRADGVVERFDATPAGLEHSLVLERRIGTAGDLVVAIALGGNAAAHGRPAAGGAVRFTQGQGGVDYGALTAIDANGARCRGTLRLVPGALEWVVPAHFADAAAFPLVLDPLVGANFQITVPLAGAPGSPYESDVDSDLAYDESTDTYLLVWQRRYSTGTLAPSITTSIRGQRLDGNGAPVGSVLAISVVDSSRSPHVANVNPSNRFAVTWVQDFFGESQVRLRAVTAGTGAMSSTAYLVGQPQGSIAVCDVAGESFTGLGVASRAWVVWVGSQQDLMCTLVDVPAGSTTPSVGVTHVLQDNVRQQGPIAICSGPSAFGRLGAVATSLSGQSLVLTVCNRDCVLNHLPETVYTNPLQPVPGSASSRGLVNAAIDGGGNNPTDFVIAVEAVLASLSGSRVSQLDVLAASSEFGQLTVSAPVLLTSFTASSYDAVPAFAAPAVAWRQGKGYVAYLSSPVGGIQVRALDPRTCTTCEGPLQAIGATTLLQPRDPAICLADSVAAGDAAEGLVVWTSNVDSVSLTGPLLGRRFDVFSSLAGTTSLGGDCGGGGSAQPTSMPYVGNTNFGMQLLFADPGSLVAVFNWNSPQPLLGCGPCQWLPFGGTITTLVTNGTAQVPLPIPCDGTLSGVQLDTQWTVWRPGVAPCPIVPDFALSNVLRLNLH